MYTELIYLALSHLHIFFVSEPQKTLGHRPFTPSYYNDFSSVKHKPGRDS